MWEKLPDRYPDFRPRRRGSRGAVVAKSNEIDGDPGPDIAHSLERLGRIMRAAEHDGELNPAQWEGLRYLGRANRFSNSPGALTRYLGATKGTVSQTLKALERKGFIAKATRPGVKRSISSYSDGERRESIGRDPWNASPKSLKNWVERPEKGSPKGFRKCLPAPCGRAAEALRKLPGVPFFPRKRTSKRGFRTAFMHAFRCRLGAT